MSPNDLPVVVFSQLAGLILVLIALPFLPATSPTAIDFAWGAAAGIALRTKAAEGGKIKVVVIGHTGHGNYGHGIDTMWLSVPAS